MPVTRAREPISHCFDGCVAETRSSPRGASTAPAADAAAAMDSYYAMLKVNRDSKFPDDVTKSYRKLALRAHPDKGGSKEAFDALHRAYEVLKDEEKRKVYDRFGFDLGDDESAD